MDSTTPNKIIETPANDEKDLFHTTT